MKYFLATIIGFFNCCWLATARESITIELKVDGIERSALVFPAQTKDQAATIKVPLVFGFHGHGGNAHQASNSFNLHEAWPEALVVYPQGLPTPGKLTDKEGKRNGWQSQQGDQDDRDLKFFDALLKELRSRYALDAQRVFVMGHSNGGAFTYLVWAYRGKDIAAVAPCAALSTGVANKLEPKPCLHIAGKNDELVRFAWQERMMAGVKRINRCEETGKVWAPDCLRYEPVVKGVGAPMVQCIHDGTHSYPENATALIVKFFKEVSIK